MWRQPNIFWNLNNKFRHLKHKLTAFRFQRDKQSSFDSRALWACLAKDILSAENLQYIKHNSELGRKALQILS